MAVEYHRRAAAERLLGQAVGVVPHAGLQGDELLHLRGHFGHLQPPQQGLPVLQHAHHDRQAHLASLLEDLLPLAFRAGLDLRQQLDHAGHLPGHHLVVHVFPHVRDGGIPGVRLHAVLAELPELLVQHVGH